MRRWTVLAIVAFAALALSGRGEVRSQDAKADEVTLKVVKYDELAKEVVKHRGKVVLIDFWHIR